MTLTQQRAEQRFACIKQGSVFYDFNISLQVGTHYDAISQLNFSLVFVPKQLQIDFKGTDIRQLIINGQTSQIKLDDGFIILDIAKLKEGHNNIALHYRNKYDNDGSGCVSFTDVDGKQYLYTQFQSYFANRVFALFDQPDIKAQMRLNVISPKTWKKVLSNEYATIQKQLVKQEYLASARTANKNLLSEYLQGKNGNMTLFPDTKLLPTYLYCVIAGEYQQLKLEETYNGIPMSLYCIQSLYKHMKQMAPFIFQITIQSMKFFESFFGYKFSFNKYDQVFAHQYKWGAMQNAAIVTFNDQYIFKQKVPTESYLNLANTISHELAHHWFGNLVTMKWWDDLWLNQSFADYISHYCLQIIKPNCKTINYQSSMAAFLANKGWGYHQDQMITTHAIRGQVPNTSVADSIFDGITYSKGAATMKQLQFLMGSQKFSAALCQYFHKYQWKNATLTDFIDVMQNHFDSKHLTLQNWRQLWLQKASLNQIQAKWNPQDKSEQANIDIEQTAVTARHPTLRPHKIKIGLFKQNDQIDVIQTFILPQSINKASYNGSNGYKAILLNFQDHTFVKNVIDLISLQFFSKNLNSIKDILSRTLIWRTFYQMIKDGQMKSSKYAEIIIGSIAKQSSDSIFQMQFDYVFNSINTYTPIKKRDELNNSLFYFIYGLLKNQQFSQNRVCVLKNKLVMFAKTSQAKQVLVNWKNGTDQDLKKYGLTIGQKWSTVVKAFSLKSLSVEQKQKLFQSVRVQDPSDTAKNKRFCCNALIANKQQFQNIYNQFKDKNNDMSITVKDQLASGWNNQVHSEWLLEYKQVYFKDILTTSQQLIGDHFQLFYQCLQPIDDDLQGQIKQYQSIKLCGDKLDKHTRNILKIIDNLERRSRAYKLYQSQ